MITVAQLKEHLSAQLHGGTLNKVRNVEALIERGINSMLSKITPVSSQRTTALVNTVHDNEFNYALPSDYNDIIDLIPQDERNSNDNARRTSPRQFDLKKMFASKQLSVEGQDGTKFLRIAWKNRSPKTLNTLNSVTDNGTWGAVGSATGIVADSIFKVSGGASIKFNVVASGDGIKNTTMTTVDMTTEDEVADAYVYVYLPAIANLTSIAARWGNDLTANYWTPVAQTTQADGSAFRAGWNLIKFPWSTATETGTVAPATIDAAQVTLNTTGAIAAVRVDNMVFSIGRPFDIKYYSKYLIKSTAGAYIARTTTDDDLITVDADEMNILINEILIEGAQQIEGVDSTFDINFAKMRLYGDRNSSISEDRIGLYQSYRAKYPTNAKKQTSSWFTPPRFNR